MKKTFAIGLTGAHRTGKTTLAREFAKNTGVPFVETNASEIFAKMGMDPSSEYPIAQRLDVQERILAEFADKWKSAIANGNGFITDRTPLDMIAYTLANIGSGEELSPSLENRLENYIQSCFDIVNYTFDFVVVVLPGIKAVHEEGKARASYACIEHIATLIMGLVVSEKIIIPNFYIPRGETDLDGRIEILRSAMKKSWKYQKGFQKVFNDQVITLH